MFQMTFGTTHAEFYAVERSPADRGIPYAVPVELCSSDFGEAGKDTCILTAAAAAAPTEHARIIMHRDWQSGESARDAAKASGVWPDGRKVGKGHGQPYLAPKWAVALSARKKLFEGRPHEGVRLKHALNARA